MGQNEQNLTIHRKCNIDGPPMDLRWSFSNTDAGVTNKFEFSTFYWFIKGVTKHEFPILFAKHL